MNPLIINADDYGLFPEADRAILYGLKQGYVNSVSVCVNPNHVKDSARNRDECDYQAVMKSRNSLRPISIGLHLNLTEGVSLVSRRRRPSALEMLASSAACPEAYSESYFREEMISQLERFSSLYGFSPDHLDSHQHLSYLCAEAFAAKLKVAREFDIPIRSPRPFLDPMEMRRFSDSLYSLHRIRLPFKTSRRAGALKDLFEQHRPRLRTENVLLHLRTTDMKAIESLRSSESGLEIVCHLQDRHERELIQRIVQLLSGSHIERHIPSDVQNSLPTQ